MEKDYNLNSRLVKPNSSPPSRKGSFWANHKNRLKTKGDEKMETDEIGKIYDEKICPVWHSASYFDVSWDTEKDDNNGSERKYGIDLYACDISNSSSVVFTFCGEDRYKMKGEIAVENQNVDRCENVFKRYECELTDIHKHYGDAKHLHFRSGVVGRETIRNFLDDVIRFVHQ